ncbi:uncharacterized protein LACBIDRAFT_326622 [Laccaria bicolor S238N-H82]|uniref:Predicted protein n=1 Tax=Laccaria bicolor (strain S238N-H82 / ATCC MYA-4686) TaxID=486041 RepID=B0D994_LACBS|nr:uncharacterized protein LACBIDRAFT_326622 [Laccaria bicolor S238N-H82]EDR08975.1 predicted protein [Laccaria bicolor S238N-H82]|eukprot:XP_001880288.1 predicted protein [Laccaria bicolor S238N-H82]
MDAGNVDESQGTSANVSVQPQGIDHLAPLLTLQKNWAKGERQAFLASHLDTYRDACLVSHASSTQALDKIINAYFVKFHWSLPHTSLPGELPTVRFDGDGFEILSAEEATHKGKVIGAMKKTIYKWYNHRNKVALTLPRSNDDEKEKWSEVVRSEWEEAKQILKDRDSAPRLLEPADAQTVLNALPSILGPLIEGVGKAVGMHITVLIGGPEPKMQGQLNAFSRRVSSMHYGVDKQAVPKVWGHADKAGFKLVTNAFTSFLETCYSPEEQRARAIPKDSQDDQPTALSSISSQTRSTSVQPTSGSKASESELSTHVGGKRKRNVKAKDGKKASKDEDEGDDENGGDEEEEENEDQANEGPDNSEEPLATRHSNRLKTRNTITITSEEHSTLTDVSMVAAPGAAREQAGPHPPIAPHRAPPVSRSPLVPPSTPSSGLTRAALGHGSTSPSQPTQSTTPMPVPALICQPSAHPSPPPLVALQPLPKPPLPIDSSWPAWFKKAYTGLSLTYLSAELASTIRIYVDFEKIANFAVGSPNAGFKVDNRPPEVAYWVGRGRKSAPPIKSIPLFEVGWWNWWKGLQLNWRSVAEVEGPLTATHHEVANGEGGWASIDKHGQNEFLTVLSCLVWWGAALNGRQGESAGWTAAVADVHWVLVNLVSTTSLPKPQGAERASPSAATTPTTKQRRK